MALALAHVAKAYAVPRGEAAAVVRDIDLSVADGESVALVGESGVGKSTLVAMMAGYTLPDAGEMTCDGRPVLGPGPDRIVVSQQDTLLPWMTVGQNARYASRLSRGAARRTLAERADLLLRRFGLWAHRDKFPKALSGGQRRRVELVRAFAVVPSVLLLDEPFSALDEGLREEMAEFLAEWRRESPRVSIVLVTHDIEEACLLGDRVLILGGRPARVVAEEPGGASVRGPEAFQDTVRRVRARYREVRLADREEP